MSLPEKLEQLLASVDSEELSHSERLWPYPFDAYDVPDFGILISYLENPEAYEDKDLVFHMENSVNCLRALKYLAEEPKFEDQEPSGDSKASFERVLDLLKSIPKPENESSAEESPPFEYGGAPRQFLLYKTKDKTPVLVDGRCKYSYNFDPPMVLLFDDGKESEAKENETIFRAIPASFADEYPVNQMDVDQIKISLKDGREVVLHLDLNFPVSDEQLDESIGLVNEEDEEKVRVGVAAALQGIPLMPADGAGIGPSDEMADVMALERERIFERSQSLSDYADFNLQAHLASSRVLVFTVPSNILIFSSADVEQQSVYPEMLAAATPDDFVEDEPVYFEVEDTDLEVCLKKHPKGLALTIYEKETGALAERISGIKIKDQNLTTISVFKDGVCVVTKENLKTAEFFEFKLDGQRVRFYQPAK